MRIVLGVWLLQAVSAAATWLALSSASRDQIVLWVGLVMGMGLIASLWFCTALRDQKRLAEAQRAERMAKHTAELHAKLARQQAEDAAKLRTLTEKVSKGRPRLLTAGFAAGGALGLCVALVLTQMLTLGLFAAGLAGGGVAGYAARGWLQRRAAAAAADATLTEERTSRLSPSRLLPGPRAKGLTLRLVKAKAA
jgi:hypothetical protein